MISKVDSESKGPCSKSFSWVEGIHDGGLLAGLDSSVVGNGSEVLNVEIEIHWVTEGSINSIQNKVLVSVVGESYKELHKFSSWQFWKEKTNQ